MNQTNKKRTTQALLLASGAAIALDCARGGILVSTGLGYLVWNLFLAWLPYLLTAYCIRPHIRSSRLVPLFLVWLLFFPNAPYLVTDVIHIGSALHHAWYDGLLFFFFGWLGLMLGMLSLRDMHAALRLRMGRVRSEIAVVAISALTGFGIYLGRFERWNSWDLFTRPSSVLGDSLAVSTGHSATPLLFTAVFTVFIYTVYKTMGVMFGSAPVLQADPEHL